MGRIASGTNSEECFYDRSFLWNFSMFSIKSLGGVSLKFVWLYNMDRSYSQTNNSVRSFRTNVRTVLRWNYLVICILLIAETTFSFCLSLSLFLFTGTASCSVVLGLLACRGSWPFLQKLVVVAETLEGCWTKGLNWFCGYVQEGDLMHKVYSLRFFLLVAG
jgi:hypothetical protein